MSDKAEISQNAITTIKQSETCCENCHQPVSGMYCSQCGQSVESTLKYFWTVILHLLDDIFSFDSRASRTLFPLIFKPGFLTNEYIAGRRVHYVPPLRLYLFVSILFFLSLKFFTVADGAGGINIGDSKSNLQQINQHIELLTKQKSAATPETLINIDKQLVKFATLKTDLSNTKNLLLKGMTSELASIELLELTSTEALTKEQITVKETLQTNIDKLKAGESIDLPGKGFTIGNNEDGSLTFDFLSKENNTKLSEFAVLLTKKGEKAFKEDSRPLVREAIEKLPQLMFILLPLFAVLLKLMFVFSKRLYLEHLTVALHSHSFLFLVILIVQLLSYIHTNSEVNYPAIASTVESLFIVLIAWVPIYLFIMQKRVYKQGYFLTSLKFSLIGASYFFMLIFTGAIAFIWGLAST